MLKKFKNVVEEKIIFKKPLIFSFKCGKIIKSTDSYAGMMELADVLDSKSSGSDTVRVQVPLPAPNSRNPNPKGSDFSLLTAPCGAAVDHDEKTKTGETFSQFCRP